MSNSRVDSWDKQMAWNERCRGKSSPDSVVVVKLKSMIRNLLATRDEADITLFELRSRNLPDIDLERFIESDGLSHIHERMKEKDAIVLPSEELRKRWHKYFGDECDASMVDPIEDRIRAIDVGDDKLNFWLHMYYSYEITQREHVAFTAFCDMLQVDPDGPQTHEAFVRWKIICMFEQLDDEYCLQ